MVCSVLDWTRLDTKVLLTNDKKELDGSPQLRSEPLLFADAELAEDEIQEVIVCRGASEGIEGMQTFV
jgi:hypothetical protein